MEDSNLELESFRQQWRAEVSARSKAEDSKRHPKTGNPPPRLRRKDTEPPRSTSEPILEQKEDTDEEQGGVYGESSGAAAQDDDVAATSKTGIREPRSALEHYERAVEKESQGSLGDSLNHYRKAFRMDDCVDQKYKNKHFPPTSKPINVNPSNASVTVPNPAHHSLHGPPQNIKDLIAGFNGFFITPAPPQIEGTPAPPCPISILPSEILVHILQEVAIIDVASFVRLAQVCKHFAYLVATEEQIWKRVCLGSEVGFGAMHYAWQREIEGGVLDEVPDKIVSSDLNPYSSWHQMFRLRPRIRFNGCYISTVNYIRPGQASPSQVTWNSPVHIVTYYRYLRFFRDGTVISLLSTTEPAEVVHHLTKDLLASHKSRANAHLPSAVMQMALRGRWRLSGGAGIGGEGDVCVETEGVRDNYMYRMDLTMRSAGKSRNNKLVWKGFWNYNKLTDDWGEFALRNDKAFFWSRVKSFGTGA